VTLTLDIVAPISPRQANRHIFTEEGGLIGRGRDNVWVLTNDKVSGKHARISFQNGVFYIEDRSTNGVAVNTPENRLVKGRPYALKHGDRLFIEPYEIDVSIGSGAAEAHAIVDPFAGDDPFSSGLPQPSASPLLDSPVEVISGGEVDPLQLLRPSAPPVHRTPDPVPIVSDDPLGAHYQPPVARDDPAMVSNSRVIPEGYNPLDDSAVVPVQARPQVEPRPRPTPRPPTVSNRAGIVPPPARGGQSQEPEIAPPQPPAASEVPAAAEPVDSDHLREVLIGAGLPDAAITPQLARGIGQILRVVVAGVIDVLQARQRIKEEFQMRQTIFRSADNNPLKFSADVNHALQNLLVTRTAAFLGPVDAFADAFDDLRNHQLAMLAGMRVAFEAMLAESDPDRLQEEFDRQISKVSLPLVPAKMRYWDLYRERRQALVKDPEAAFAKLFGDEFARAYEDQFQMLKEQHKERPGGPPPNAKSHE
jgi:type VI secretion system FHA domain protein